MSSRAICTICFIFQPWKKLSRLQASLYHLTLKCNQFNSAIIALSLYDVSDSEEERAGVQKMKDLVPILQKLTLINMHERKLSDTLMYSIWLWLYMWQFLILTLFLCLVFTDKGTETTDTFYILSLIPFLKFLVLFLFWHKIFINYLWNI